MLSSLFVISPQAEACDHPGKARRLYELPPEGGTTEQGHLLFRSVVFQGQNVHNYITIRLDASLFAGIVLLNGGF